MMHYHRIAEKKKKLCIGHFSKILLGPVTITWAQFLLNSQTFMTLAEFEPATLETLALPLRSDDYFGRTLLLKKPIIIFFYFI